MLLSNLSRKSKADPRSDDGERIKQLSGGIVVKDGAGRAVPASAGSEPQTWTWPAKAGDAFVVNFAAGH